MSHSLDLEHGLDAALYADDLPRAQQLASTLSASSLVAWMRREPATRQAVLFRLLPKDQALEVFETLPPTAAAELVRHLGDEQVTGVFAALDPDDRVRLLDELPAGVATRLLAALSGDEKDLTTIVMGYPAQSVGRRMSPEVRPLRGDMLASTGLERVRSWMDEVETVYTIPVVDDARRVVAVVGLRDLLRATADQTVADVAQVPFDVAPASESAEEAARRCTSAGRLALPVVDSEGRLVGIFTVDDALRTLGEAEREDHARQGGTEPLRSSYLTTPISRLVRTRVVWLLVLAIGATLTVRVLEGFEATLDQMVVLSVFIPLLIGTGGNTGNQAATTVTRALATGEVRGGDLFRILGREAAVGLSLGLILGGIGFSVVALVYGLDIAQVVGLTLVLICTLAAVVGGVIPLAAKALRADPAVFSNPFISTLLDASGLIIYFLIARWLLGL